MSWKPFGSWKNPHPGTLLFSSRGENGRCNYLIPIVGSMSHIAIWENYIVGEHRLDKSCTIMFQPHNVIALAGKRISSLHGWHKDMNWMFRCVVLNGLDWRYHIAISRDNYSDVATFGKHIGQHSSSHSHVRLFLFVGFILKATILAFELLFLISA